MGNSPIDGASCGTKVPSAVPVANPFGREAMDEMYSRYSSLVLNSLVVVGFSVWNDDADRPDDESIAELNTACARPAPCNAVAAKEKLRPQVIAIIPMTRRSLMDLSVHCISLIRLGTSFFFGQSNE